MRDCAAGSDGNGSFHHVIHGCWNVAGCRPSTAVDDQGDGIAHGVSRVAFLQTTGFKPTGAILIVGKRDFGGTLRFAGRQRQGLGNPVPHDGVDWCA